MPLPVDLKGSASGSRSKPKLLIADDEATERTSLRRGLGRSYDIIEAVDGGEAWERIREEKPDLVLLDLNMPKLGGFQILEKIKTVEDPPLVVMITAYGSERIAVEAMKAGAYDYIAKPFDLDELRLSLSHASEK
ncbi:MAG: response regulator, partial [Fidelibacterota bacterium]